MMQRNERLLLRAWIAYHGYLFGFENLYIFDNGSTDLTVLGALKEFEGLGVNVDYTKSKPSDFEHKGKVIGELIELFKKTDAYDIAIPLDCDEFLSINGSSGITCNRSQILAELGRIYAAGGACRTSYCLDNRPGFVDLFRYIAHVKSIVIVQKFCGIDHGFHQASLPLGDTYGATALIHIHMHFKPFDVVLQSARDKLAPYVNVDSKEELETFSGVGNHLTKYFRMDREGYYAYLHGYTLPLVKFSGLSKLLSAVADFCSVQLIWEADRPSAVGSDLLQIDLDQSCFRPNDYLNANPDLPRSGMDPFMHFLRAGYVEGRRLAASHSGYEEVVRRMAEVRHYAHDGRSGLIGCAIAYSRLGRGQEADGLLSAAIEEYGETKALLREYALSAMYQENYTSASARWARFRDVFPQEADGFHYGALAGRRVGNLQLAESLAASGVARFPSTLGL